VTSRGESTPSTTTPVNGRCRRATAEYQQVQAALSEHINTQRRANNQAQW